MTRFPIDAPKRRVVKVLEILGFHIVREKEHISMLRKNPMKTSFCLWQVMLIFLLFKVITRCWYVICFEKLD